MYKKILVPLDGSPLAECVLPHVQTIVKVCQSPEITLIRAVEPVTVPNRPFNNGEIVYTEAESLDAMEKINKANMKDAGDYLIKITSGFEIAGATLHTEVIKGKAAETVADYAQKNNVDLIIIATHGRSGISRWVVGSTADKILRSSCVPVFMIRPPGCIPGF